MQLTNQALARKWRPRNFQQMIGQEHVLRMLNHALNLQRLHHAYLLTGTRGVGKTTLGRILAKCLNCEIGITAQPCGICKNCIAIDDGRFLDLLEIDAASRTKVEDTRELLDNVQYQPTQGRFKVYLIDEVHMLSGHSFNALLKTLEEPPPYVKFLLATTDSKRLPITILSRCLQFHLKHVSSEAITQHLQQISTLENIPHELDALQLLAKAAEGSVRDALSLLDQAIAFCGGTITTKDTQEMLGTIEKETLYRLLTALSKQDGSQIINDIQNMSDLGVDFHHALEELLSILHQINLLHIVKDIPQSNEHLIALSRSFSAEEIQLYYQIALIGRRDLPFTPNPQQGFEMVFLRMLAFQPEPDTSNDSKELSKQQISETIPCPSNLQWHDILSKIELSGMAHALASNCMLTHFDNNKMSLTLSVQHQPMYNKKLADRIEQALSRYFNKPIQLDIHFATTEVETPFKKHQQEQTTKQTAADEAIKNDNDAQNIMKLFDATLSSVTPIDKI